MPTPGGESLSPARSCNALPSHKNHLHDLRRDDRATAGNLPPGCRENGIIPNSEREDVENTTAQFQIGPRRDPEKEEAIT